MPKKHEGPVRIVTDLSTSEWFWLASDAESGELTVIESGSFSSESDARAAAAEDHGVPVEELERAEANPTEDELAVQEAEAKDRAAAEKAKK